MGLNRGQLNLGRNCNKDTRRQQQCAPGWQLQTPCPFSSALQQPWSQAGAHSTLCSRLCSGMTMNDLLFRVKIDVLTQQVRQKIVAGRDKVSDAQIAAYYAKNKARFAQPERRDLQVVSLRVIHGRSTPWPSRRKRRAPLGVLGARDR